jgi:hypothetical protein
MPTPVAVVAGAVPAYLGVMSKVLPETLPGTVGHKLGPFAAVAGVFAALALAGSVLLWAHYGTTVFFETIRAGFAACFG